MPVVGLPQISSTARARFPAIIDRLLELLIETLYDDATAQSTVAAQAMPLFAEMEQSLVPLYGTRWLHTRSEPQALCTAMLGLRELLASDVSAALANDPATIDPLEVIYCYPGFQATTAHRLARILWLGGWPLVPRMIAERAHQLTGIDIHPGAELGSHCFIDHGTGTVIGATAILGNHVTLYQGVTLGAKRLQRDADGAIIKGQPRHPVLGDHVTVYSGASILGRIHVGAHSVIGGNVWLTHSVPEHSRVLQQNVVMGFTDGDGI